MYMYTCTICTSNVYTIKVLFMHNSLYLMDVAFDRGYIGGGGLVHSQLGELMIRDLCVIPLRCSII